MVKFVSIYMNFFCCWIFFLKFFNALKSFHLYLFNVYSVLVRFIFIYTFFVVINSKMSFSFIIFNFFWTFSSWAWRNHTVILCTLIFWYKIDKKYRAAFSIFINFSLVISRVFSTIDIRRCRFQEEKFHFFSPRRSRNQ